MCSKHLTKLKAQSTKCEFETLHDSLLYRSSFEALRTTDPQYTQSRSAQGTSQKQQIRQRLSIASDAVVIMDQNRVPHTKRNSVNAIVRDILPKCAAKASSDNVAPRISQKR